MNVNKYLEAFEDGQPFRLIIEATPANLRRAGFADNAAPNATLLPNIWGKTTRFNAEGKWLPDPKQPIEEDVIERYTKRSLFAGRGRREIVYDYYEFTYRRRPKYFVPPPSIELSLVQNGEDLFICSPLLTKAAGNTVSNRHAFNLMLELFGTVEVVSQELERLEPPRLQRVNWRLLPPGDQPFERIREHIREALAHRPEEEIALAVQRQEFIYRLRPDREVIGMAGFKGYIAYVFEGRGLTVLENLRVGNAVYVLGENWEAISQMTKAEIVNNDLAEARIVHGRGWQEAVQRIVAA